MDNKEKMPWTLKKHNIMTGQLLMTGQCRTKTITIYKMLINNVVNDGQLVFVNDILKKIIGYSMEEETTRN